MSNINAARCEVLQRHRVTLYPDLGATAKWEALRHQLPRCIVSYFLEGEQDKLNDGDDLGDYLLHTG